MRFMPLMREFCGDDTEEQERSCMILSYESPMLTFISLKAAGALCASGGGLPFPLPSEVIPPVPVPPKPEIPDPVPTEPERDPVLDEDMLPVV